MTEIDSDIANYLDQLSKELPSSIDLTNDSQSTLIFDSVDRLMDKGPRFEDIVKLEQSFLDVPKDERSIFLLLILKVLKSKLLVSQITEPLHVSLVFAMYKEHNRIRKQSEHPHGEDFLRKKHQQLHWLFESNDQVDWDMILVDDGCPEGSGKIAENIIDQEGYHDNIRVLFLADAIKNRYPTTSTLSSTSDSQKGGSILYGMWDASHLKKSNRHIICFTDADLSTHLGQLMLLVEPIISQGKLAAIGSRRERDSVVVKKSARNNRGKLFIYLWKRLIPNLSNIIDTQCGFKAFDANIISHIVKDPIESKFAFDIELLIKTQMIRANSIAKVPIAWIDSEDASTTTDIQPYLPMLKAIAKMSESYMDVRQEQGKFVRFIQNLDVESFNDLLSQIPESITEREPLEFETFDAVSAEQLSGLIK